VLAARHLGRDEPVAIEVLLPAMMQVAGMVERFTREARASGKIENDHISLARRRYGAISIKGLDLGISKAMQ
jgi:hypothetical protein